MRRTMVNNLQKGDRVVDPNGSTVEVSGIEKATLKVRGSKIPAVTVSGKCDGFDYTRTAQSGEFWEKI